MDYEERMASRYAEEGAVDKALRIIDGVGIFTVLRRQIWGRLVHGILRCWRFGMRVEALSSLCVARDRWRLRASVALSVAHDLQSERQVPVTTDLRFPLQRERCCRARSSGD